MSSLITTVLSNIAGPIMSIFYNWLTHFNTISISSICIPFISQNLISQLISDSTYIVDIDAEINENLDDDEQKMECTGNLLSPRVVYSKSLAIIEELKNIITHSSKAVNSFIFVSSDYRLLKFAQVGKSILYFVPSENYYQELKTLPNWNDVKYQKIKNDLLNRKKEKLIVYHSLLDLQKLICENFHNVSIKI